MSGNLAEADVTGLEDKRKEFFVQKIQAERLSEAMKGERFEQLYEYSPKLQSLCTAYGKENIQELLQTGASELPFLDQKAFKEFNAVLDQIETFEKNIEEPLQKELTIFCERFKLTEDKVVKAMENKNPLQRRAELETAIRDNMTGWAVKLPKWLPAQWSGRVIGRGEKRKDAEMTKMQRYNEYGIEAVKFARNHNEWKNAIEMRSDVLEKQGDFIASFVSKNKEIRQALGRVVNDERPYFKEVVDETVSYDDARGLLLTEKTVKNAVRDYKSIDANKNIDFANLPTADLDMHMGKIFDAAQQNAQKESGKRNGFWMRVVGAIFGTAQERTNFIQNTAMRKSLAGA